MPTFVHVCMITDPNKLVNKRMLSFRIEESSNDDNDNPIVEGRWLFVQSIPEEIEERYVSIPKKILIRKCYEDLYEQVSAVMHRQQQTRPAFLFTGVPGIGKSLFMIYFLYRYSVDDRFTDKRFAVEIAWNTYCFCVPTKVVGEYSVSQVDSTRFPRKEVVVFSDILQEMEPAGFGKWLLVFSSPDPRRYKTTLRLSMSFIFYLPTWSEMELCAVNPNIEEWYNRFQRFGGVARDVLWNYDENGETPYSPEKMLEIAIVKNGRIVAENAFHIGFHKADDEIYYTLIHINPLTSEDGSVIYSDIMFTFASDYVFRRLKSIIQKSLVLEATAWFCAGGEISVQKYGAATARWMFKRICLWCVPLAGRELCCEPLGANLPPLDKFTLPDIEVLSFPWKQEQNLVPNLLYQSSIADMEAGDSFCVMEINDAHMLIVLQVTNAASNPVKANGLKLIYDAYPEAVRNKIKRKLLIFVTPKDGKLQTAQPFDTKNHAFFKRPGDIPLEAANFEQWKYEYVPVITD